MSIINNAHPGSSIRLINLIDRVLVKRKGEAISRQELLDLCHPSNLPGSMGAEKRFESNLNFWIKEGLWSEDISGIALADKESSVNSLQNRILNLLIDNALLKENQNICHGNGIEPFLSSITCLLAQEKFTFIGGHQLTPGESGNVAQSVNSLLPVDMSINSSNESPILLEYGFYLGFLEPLNSGFIVDPTRSIESYLNKVFISDKELSIRDFIKKISTLLPMLDGGCFRQQIELLMRVRGWVAIEEHKISLSMSHAINRLVNSFAITLHTRSDDSTSMVMSTPNGETEISVVRYQGDNT